MSQSEGVMVMCVRGFVYVCVKEVFYDEFVGSWWLMQTLLFPPALCPHTPGESWVKHWLTVCGPSSQPDSNSTSLVSISMFVWVPLCLLDPCPLKHTLTPVLSCPQCAKCPNASLWHSEQLDRQLSFSFTSSIQAPVFYYYFF